MFFKYNLFSLFVPPQPAIQFSTSSTESKTESLNIALLAQCKGLLHNKLLSHYADVCKRLAKKAEIGKNL